MENKDNFLQWSEYEYEYKEKGPDWFWVVGIVSVCIAVGSILMGNILFAILIIISAATLSMYAIRRPKEVLFRLDERGVTEDKTFYPFEQLESFWVEEDSDKKKIILKSRKPLMPYVTIPVGNGVNAKEIRGRLSKFLKEEKMSESASQKIMERLGF